MGASWDARDDGRPLWATKSHSHDADLPDKQDHAFLKLRTLPAIRISLRLPRFCASAVLRTALCAAVGASAFGQLATVSWRGKLRDTMGNPLVAATIELRESRVGRMFTSTSDPNGAFVFSQLAPGAYSVSVRWAGGAASSAAPVEIREGGSAEVRLEISADQRQLSVRPAAGAVESQASGGERLSSREVSGLPLNKRDFSQLLLLAAGTMTDANGAANFTQQFAVNGQRGSTTVFAMDGIDTTDPEMGGSTFSNFNVDAIQEIRSSSGVMPAEIGHGASAFTEVVTLSLIHISEPTRPY